MKGPEESSFDAMERLIGQAEQRQGARLWSQVRRHLERLCAEDPEVMLGLLTGALEKGVQRPCSWLYYRTSGGTKPEPRPSWNVAGTVHKRVIRRVQAVNATEARMRAKQHYLSLGAEFSPSNHGTERV